jgi:hypothetical protein
MSDTAVAPDTAPPSQPAPQPSQTEVPVNPNPVSAPAPVGSQAPAKPEAPPTSRREAIQRAFAKADAKPKPEAAKPKIGHNQPPEPIDREKPTIDLKRRPDDQPGQTTSASGTKPDATQRERAEHGHFAPRQQQGRQPPSADRGVAPQQPGVQHAQLPETAPYRDPPVRLHERAKADWAATPESVRGEIHRANGEFQRAYGQYRQDHQVMETIRPFQQMAAQQGTTLERALSSYTSMEQRLRQDPVAGFDVITQNLNLRADDGTPITFRDICWHVINQTPEQHQLVQAKNMQAAQHAQIGQLHREISQLATGIKQMQYQNTFSQTRSALDRYADAHPRFDELGDLIEQEIKLGFTLDQAYARADRLRPATHAPQTRTPTAQTRTTGKSISGAPAGPTNGTGRPQRPVGRREAITNAIKRAGGSL